MGQSAEAVFDEKLIAYCGLYCGACGRYLNGKCPGCAMNSKATWCKARSCCIEKGRKSCAECKEFSEIMECSKFNNVISRVFGFIFRSNRRACIEKIKEQGYRAFAKEMAETGRQTIKR
jgi:hypothetical protein